MSVRILIGDVRAELAELADESVHCVVTSSPYWGLRDYGTPPMIWNGASDCKHRWGAEVIRSKGGKGQNKGLNNPPDSGVRQARDHDAQELHQGAFCRKCGAWKGQLGLEPTIELYVEHMVEVFREVRRVLRKDGTLWLNMGDCYAAAKGNMGDRGSDNKGNRSANFDGSPHRKMDRHQGGLAGNRPKRRDMKHKSTPAHKSKDLVGQPWRVAFALQADGWWLRSDIIWAKPNPMPESCRDRPTKSHEYVFMLTKSGASTFWAHRDKGGTCTAPKPDYIWIDRAAEYLDAHMAELWGERLAAGFKALGFTPNLSAARKLIEHREEPEGWKTERFPRLPKSWPAAPHDKRWKRLNLWTGYDYFFDQEAVREKGITDPKAIIARVEAAKRAKTRGKIGEVSNLENWGAQEAWSDGCRNIRSVWTIPTQAFPEAHFATFPEALPERCIKAGTSERGCCPECGAPWVRVVEKKEGTPDPARGWDTAPGAHGREKRRLPKHPRGDQTSGSGRIALSVARARKGGGEHDNPFAPSVTTGWLPSCPCHKPRTDLPVGPPVPCTVLDPFMGAGTTALVALKLGRRAIGIELNPKYAEMARRRLEREIPLLMGAL